MGDLIDRLTDLLSADWDDARKAFTDPDGNVMSLALARKLARRRPTTKKPAQHQGESHER